MSRPRLSSCNRLQRACILVRTKEGNFRTSFCSDCGCCPNITFFPARPLARRVDCKCPPGLLSLTIIICPPKISGGLPPPGKTPSQRLYNQRHSTTLLFHYSTTCEHTLLYRQYYHCFPLHSFNHAVPVAILYHSAKPHLLPRSNPNAQYLSLDCCISPEFRTSPPPKASHPSRLRASTIIRVPRQFVFGNPLSLNGLDHGPISNPGCRSRPHSFDVQPVEVRVAEATRAHRITFLAVRSRLALALQVQRIHRIEPGGQ
jgi:hypothetical protein